jgi:hypothetical protein
MSCEACDGFGYLPVLDVTALMAQAPDDMTVPMQTKMAECPICKPAEDIGRAG